MQLFVWGPLSWEYAEPPRCFITIPFKLWSAASLCYSPNIPWPRLISVELREGGAGAGGGLTVKLCAFLSYFGKGNDVAAKYRHRRWIQTFNRWITWLSTVKSLVRFCACCELTFVFITFLDPVVENYSTLRRWQSTVSQQTRRKKIKLRCSRMFWRINPEVLHTSMKFFFP